MLVSHRAFSTPMLHIQISWLVPSDPPIRPRFPCTKLSPFQSQGRWKSPGVRYDTINLSLQRFRYYSVEPRNWPPASLFEEDINLSLQRFRYYSVEPRNWPPANLFEEDGSVIGDCVVYEKDVFENPFVAANEENSAEEDDDRDGLIPEDWKDLQRGLNMAKKEKKKRMQMMELSNSFQKKKEFELSRDDLSDSNSIKLPKITFLNSDSNSNLSGKTERLSAAGFGRTAHGEVNIENELTLLDNNCFSDEQKKILVLEMKLLQIVFPTKDFCLKIPGSRYPAQGSKTLPRALTKDTGQKIAKTRTEIDQKTIWFSFLKPCAPSTQNLI